MNRQVLVALVLTLIFGCAAFWFFSNGQEKQDALGSNGDLTRLDNGRTGHGSGGGTHGHSGSGTSGSNNGGSRHDPAHNSGTGTGTNTGVVSSRHNGGHSAAGTPGTGTGGTGTSTYSKNPGGNGGGTGSGHSSALRPFKGKGVGMLIAQVLNEKGEGHPDASVLLRSSYGDIERDADGTGVAVYEKLPAGNYTLSVASDAGFQGKSTAIRLANGETKRVTLRCAEGGQVISGRALDTEGNVLADVQVVLSAQSTQGDVIDLWAFEEDELVTTTGGDGFYEFEDLPGGTFLLTAEWAETGETKRRNVSAPSKTEDLIFRAPLAVEISGVCRDENDMSLEGVMVSVLGRNVVVARTDSRGYYQLITRSASWSGTIYLRAQKQGYKKQQKSISLDRHQDGQDITVDFKLQSMAGEGEINGLLVNTDGEPVAGETVLLVSSKKRVQSHARTADDGSFFFDGLEAASDYRLSVFPKEKYQDLRKTGIVLGEAESIQVELVLQPIESCIVSGVALNGDKEPLPGFAFRIRSDQSWSQDIRVVTAPDGSFRQEDVPAGSILFDTWATPHHSIRGLKLAAGEEKEVTLIFGVGDYSVEGQVQDEAGSNIPGAQVVISWLKQAGSLNSSVQHSTVTDPSGWFRVMDLANGDYRIQVRANGFVTQHFKQPLRGNDRWQFQLKRNENN